MSCLIMLSPQKTGRKETGTLEIDKFVSTPVPSRLLGQTGVTCYPMYLRWAGDRFIVLARLDSASSSFKRVWHVLDAADGFEGNGTAQSGNVPPTNTFGMEYGEVGTSIVAVSSNGSTSDNGTSASVSNDLGFSWTSRALGAASQWRNPVCGLSADRSTVVWMVHTQTAIQVRKSIDGGTTWVVKAPKTRGNIAYSPVLNRWVQMPHDLALPWYSDDAGESWIVAQSYAASSILPSTFSRQAAWSYSPVRWINDRFIALESSSTAFMYSLDGINWSEIQIPALEAAPTHVIYGSGLWLICAENSNTYAYSLDGITWDRSAFPAGFLFAHGDYGGGKFMFVNANATKIYAYAFG